MIHFPERSLIVMFEGAAILDSRYLGERFFLKKKTGRDAIFGYGGDDLWKFIQRSCFMNPPARC